ncbi:hypothetical protein LZ554_002045 [Drepanopeziza brunnea f. sp. 'monogermtubi']|nr:hypothetical protein LZ554_002045 [Drepanopeziza brunnea f. sp. 'monogermtubi']
MYFSLLQTTTYIQSCTALAPLALSRHIDLIIIPDFLSLSSASTTIQLYAPTIRIGAQDCFWEDRGAYTGEVSPASLHELGCSVVELGHAERRRLFGEGDAMVARKAQAAEQNGLMPLVCVGERQRGSVEGALGECRAQVESVLAVTRGEVIFAYEPVWAIGMEVPADPEYVVDVAKGLRALCGERKVRILYGGSAGPGTFGKMKEEVDGLFLGRFAHDAQALEEVIGEVGSGFLRGSDQ